MASVQRRRDTEPASRHARARLRLTIENAQLRAHVAELEAQVSDLETMIDDIDPSGELRYRAMWCLT